MAAREAWTAEALRLGSRVRLEEPYQRVAIGEVSAAPPAGEGSPLRVDPDLVRATLARLLEASGSFERVAPEVGDPLGLVIDVDLSGALLRHADERDRPAASWVGYAFLGFLTDWLRDQTFEVRSRPTIRLRDGLSGEVVRTVRLGPSVSRTALSFVERRPETGPFVATIFYWPPLLFDPSEEAVGERLWPVALMPIARATLEAMADLDSGHRARFTRSETAPAALRLAALRPPAGAIFRREGATLELRVEAALSLGRIKGAQLGPVRAKAKDGVVSLRLASSAMEPSRLLDLRVEMEDGRELVLGRLVIEPALGARTGKVALGGVPK